MESHQQRMGILSRYVETANYSLGEDADGADLWSNTNFKWKNNGKVIYIQCRVSIILILQILKKTM